MKVFFLPLLTVTVMAAMHPACAQAPEKGTTTLDIRNYLLDNSPWVDRNRTVDTVKSGDPGREVKKAGVCWYPSMDTIKAAKEAGCDLLVCHEPTFWEHAAPEKKWRTRVPCIAKEQFLEESGLVILRAHDTWDQWPELGIRDSWARFLGLDKCIHASTGDNYTALYEVPRQTLRELAQKLADRVKTLGEDSVQVMGDPDRVVGKPAIGVGCAVPDAEMVEAGADVLVMCYDGASYWSTRERIVEMGACVITVEHGTSEMPGMESLCKHLAEKFPNVTFQYFDNHPKTWTVRGK